MITENMKLNSASDAKQWASDFGLENPVQEKKLATWLWNNKPNIGCWYSEHPISRLPVDKFWGIVE